MILVHASRGEGSTESDKDQRLINTTGRTSVNPRQLSWNLEDEETFASQRGGESSKKEGKLVSRYTKILVYSSTAFKDVKGGAVLRAHEESQSKRQSAV